MTAAGVYTLASEGETMKTVGDYLSEWDRGRADRAGESPGERFHRRLTGWVMVSVVVLPGLAASAGLLIGVVVAGVWAWRYVVGG